MTQATLPRTIPPPQPDDCEDVVSALETAELFWNRGDSEEALRWLRRAIETAGDIGADTRAAALARAAADLKSATSTAPAPVRDGLSTRPPPPSAMRARTEPVSLEALEPDPRKTLVGFTLPVRSGAEPRPAPPPEAEVGSEDAASSDVATTAASPAGEGDVMPRGDDVALREGDIREGDVTLREGEGTQPAGEVFATKPSEAAEPVARLVAGGRPFPRSALHVYVMPDNGDGERLDVRVLRAGELPPRGAERALLVPLEREVDLVAPGPSKTSTNVR